VRRLLLSLILLAAPAAAAQTVTIDPTQRFQTIDGFGTASAGTEPATSWWQQLYFDDLGASMMRMLIDFSFASPYSNESYCSPWFGQPAPLNLDTATSGNNGPDGTRTRPYTGPSDYSTAFGGCSAPMAIMGPDIDANQAFFDFTSVASAAAAAKAGQSMAQTLGGFKLYVSILSPAPWLKSSSGNEYGGGAWPLPTAGVPWPFIWGGNFSGGTLDTSGTPIAEFTDSTGAETSALTQFARGLAAFLHGIQTTYGIQVYAVSLQNELNFEEFYSSATYPLAAEYIATLEAARAELDSHPDLAGIQIVGPEDLLGGDAYSLWQYGSGASEVDKNLQYLADIAKDPDAGAAIAGFAIHGYDSNGVTAAGASASQWQAWADGWTTSPAAGIPADVVGFTSYGKRSWMTETSGEDVEWLASSQGDGGFPDQGAFSIGVKLHQALTAGLESAWLYLDLTDGSPSNDSDVGTLTDATQLGTTGKYSAVKHFFKYIRPGAVRIAANVTGANASQLLASAYVLDATGALTVVLVNEGSSAVTASLAVPSSMGFASLQAYTSSAGSYWQGPTTATLANGSGTVSVPGYGLVTLTGAGSGQATGTTGGSGTSSGGVGTTGGLGGTSGIGGTNAGRGASGGTASGGGSGSGTGGTRGSTGSTSTPPTAAQGGCSCRTGASGDVPLLFALLLGLAASRSRRRSLDDALAAPASPRTSK